MPCTTRPPQLFQPIDSDVPGANITVAPSSMVSVGFELCWTSTSQVTWCSSLAAQVSSAVIVPQCSVTVQPSSMPPAQLSSMPLKQTSASPGLTSGLVSSQSLSQTM